MNKKLISKYNLSTALLVISSYPPKGTTYGDSVGGVASYCKNSVVQLSHSKPVVVLAEILDKPAIYQEDGVLVYRCWRRNFPGIYLDLLKAVRLFPNIKQAIVQFEFALYGDFWITGALPLFLTLLRVLRRQLTTVIHQVVLDLKCLNGHLGWQKKSLKSKFYSFLMRQYYRLISISSNSIVVLEEEFKERLKILGISDKKIRVIKHGVDLSIKPMSRSSARKIISITNNEFVVLCFGFLTWYKGSDLAVKAVKKIMHQHPDCKIRLILAGGESLTQKEKTGYASFIKKLYQQADGIPNITVTGFVPEKMIGVYHSAADLVLLPYRTYMSSSGVLSLALSYGKPCLISTALGHWLEDEEINTELKSHMTVKPAVSEMAESILYYYQNKESLKKNKEAIKRLAVKRNYRQLSSAYFDLVSYKQNHQKEELLNISVPGLARER